MFAQVDLNSPSTLFIAAQTGALIYFSGVVSTTLRALVRRTEKNATGIDDLKIRVAKLEVKEEL